MKHRPLQNEKGVAMMMALVTMVLLAVLVAELVYESSVYNGIVFRQVDQLNARLLARSGLRMGLLQLRAAEKAKAKAKSMGLGENTTLTDQIWKTPLVLPPPSIPGLGVAESTALDGFSKSLGLRGRVSVTITGENSRLGLSQLVWVSQAPTNAAGSNTTGSGSGPAGGPAATGPAQGGTMIGGSSTLSPEKKKELLEATRKSYAEALDQLLENKRQQNNSFRDKYSGVNGTTLLGHLLAWIDPETKMDGDNRDKNDYYARLEPTPYALKNAPMASESELFMVKGFDDAIAQLFADAFSVQATSALNVNQASAGLLRALLPELSESDAEKVVKRRSDEKEGGPFGTAEEFWTYLNTLGDYAEAKARLEKQGIKVLGPETSYRVSISATSGLATKTWMALVGPLPPSETTPQQPGQTPQASTPAPTQTSLDDTEEKFNEKADQAQKTKASDSPEPLNILYLKAD